MLVLKNGVNVRMIKETESIIKVRAVNSCGFDVNGKPMFEEWTLSKKYHKDSLLLDGVSII
ncbi:hypothetical protein VPIG_00073 [Vibrio phage PWH3a-P1]|uniref:hypothetical protein n=1 Tax=Vibrio phage PWH3a-P1 TaxID=754058 RepID=UPI0002C0B834|nr:hypothetical protein VPIG_00073 [Vibrio phage PWH3a-P1]AGH31931.1 hypothetical protein VPIG_00073 [Vibrio phage PWH3a-P1]